MFILQHSYSHSFLHHMTLYYHAFINMKCLVYFSPHKYNINQPGYSHKYMESESILEYLLHETTAMLTTSCGHKLKHKPIAIDKANLKLHFKTFTSLRHVWLFFFPMSLSPFTCFDSARTIFYGSCTKCSKLMFSNTYMNYLQDNTWSSYM